MEKIKFKENYLLYGFLTLVVILGIIVRFVGLGKYPLAVDEFYTIKSAEHILQFGVPKFVYGGGYYVRGLLYQYFVAPLLIAGVKPEFAGRVITVLTNLAALLPLYFLVKKLSGKFLGAMVVFIFCFSVWEVEFARFARMYAPFQFIFICYLFFLYGVLIENDHRSKKWLYIFSFISIFVYEASIFLVILNFLPVVWSHEKKTIYLEGIYEKDKIINLLISVCIFIFAFIFLRIGFRGADLADLPPDVVGYYEGLKHESVLYLPKLLILTLPSIIWGLLFLIPLAYSFTISIRTFKEKSTGILIEISYISLLVLSLFNLFGFVILLLSIFLIINWLSIKDLKQKLFLYVSSAVILNLIFWTAFAFLTRNWETVLNLAQSTGINGRGKNLFEVFFKYPDLYDIFRLYSTTIPRFTVISITLIFVGFLFLIKKEKNSHIGIRVLYFLFLLLGSLVAVINTYYFDTRYTFFIFPILLIMVVWSVFKLSNLFRNTQAVYLSFAMLFILFLFVSEDFSPKHLFGIDSPKYNYRIGMSRQKVVHYYPRWDERTPSEIINKEAGKNDLIVTNEISSDFYLNRLDYFFLDYKDADFLGQAVDHGKKERWTGANLVYRYKDLVNLLDNGDRTKWCIINRMWRPKDFKRVDFFKKFKKDLYYSSVDGHLLLYKIPGK